MNKLTDFITKRKNDNKHSFIIDNFNNNDKWLVTSCSHTNDGVNMYNEHQPRWNDNIHLGVNTISSPSVLAFYGKELFDENLVMLMDCEMYYQLYIRYGIPKIITDCLVTNRLHQHQISSLYKKDMHLEINHVRNKHNI